MSRHHDELYLQHIQEAITKAMEWARVSRDTFMNDDFRQSAVIRQLGGSLRNFGRSTRPLKRER